MCGILRTRAREPVAVSDRELVHRFAPFLRGTAPVSGDVAQRQPDQFLCCIVAGKVSSHIATGEVLAETTTRTDNDSGWPRLSALPDRSEPIAG